MTIYRIMVQTPPGDKEWVYRSRANNLSGIYTSLDSVRRVLLYLDNRFRRSLASVRVESAEVEWHEVLGATE